MPISTKMRIACLLAAAALALPAAAQEAKPVAADQKQCADRFKAADLDNDGVLSRAEIGNAKQKLPSALANRDRVTRKDFMSVCGKSAG